MRAHLKLAPQSDASVSHHGHEVEADLAAGVALDARLNGGLHPVQPILLSAPPASPTACTGAACAGLG